jgi:hypothetical protein
MRNSSHYFILHNKTRKTTIMTRYSQFTVAALSLLLSASGVSAASVRRREAPQVWTVSESLRVPPSEESTDVEPRIVGGDQASESEFPWFATSSGVILCGASLIHKQFLL